MDRTLRFSGTPIELTCVGDCCHHVTRIELAGSRLVWLVLASDAPTEDDRQYGQFEAIPERKQKTLRGEPYRWLTSRSPVALVKGLHARCQSRWDTCGQSIVSLSKVWYAVVLVLPNGTLFERVLVWSWASSWVRPRNKSLLLPLPRRCVRPP